MDSAYLPPRVNGYDIVAEIRKKRQNARRKKVRTRCFGTNSCDCPRCR